MEHWNPIVQRLACKQKYVAVFNKDSHSSVWNRLVFRHEFILKSEIFKFKRTMFAKLFGVKAPFSKYLIFHDASKV